MLMTQPIEPILKLLPPEGKSQAYRCEVTNTSKVSWYFHGNVVKTSSPALPPGRVVTEPIIQHLTNGNWETQRNGRCGVGISPIELTAGSTVWFELNLMFPQNADSRVGLYMNYGKEGSTYRHVWSNAVKPPGK